MVAVVSQVISMIGVLAGIAVLVLASAIVGHACYTWYRTRDARPLTPEEQWQETSEEALGDAWAADPTDTEAR